MCHRFFFFFFKERNVPCYDGICTICLRTISACNLFAFVVTICSVWYGSATAWVKRIAAFFRSLQFVYILVVLNAFHSCLTWQSLLKLVFNGRFTFLLFLLLLLWRNNMLCYVILRVFSFDEWDRLLLHTQFDLMSAILLVVSAFILFWECNLNLYFYFKSSSVTRCCRKKSTNHTQKTITSI